MGNTGKRAKGAADELRGRIKGAVGKAIGNEQLQVEGKLKELKGKGQQEAAKVSERARGKLEELVGKMKNRLGTLIDNQQLQAEGKLRELKGQARQKANK